MAAAVQSQLQIRKVAGEVYMLTTQDYQAESRPVGSVYKVVDPYASPLPSPNKPRRRFDVLMSESLQMFMKKMTFDEITGEQQKLSSTIGYSITNMKVTEFGCDVTRVETTSEPDEILIKISGCHGSITADFSATRNKRWSKKPASLSGSFQGEFSESDAQMKTTLLGKVGSCTSRVTNLQLEAVQNNDLTVPALLTFFKTAVQNVLQEKICSSLMATFASEHETFMLMTS